MANRVFKKYIKKSIKYSINIDSYYFMERSYGVRNYRYEETSEETMYPFKKIYEDTKYPFKKIYKDTKYTIKKISEDTKHTIKKISEDTKHTIKKISEDTKYAIKKILSEDTKGFINSVFGEFSNSCATNQLAIGTATGWLTGMVAMKMCKVAAIVLGGGIILLQVASNQGYININWDKLYKQGDKEKETGSGPTWMDKIVTYARKNQCRTAGFVGGFLIGCAF